MIIEERLKELIEQNKTIYTTYGGYVSEIEIDKTSDYIKENYFYEASIVAKQKFFTKYTFNILFETKEEAEWHIEFGCIERTEKLKLPTWEEIQKYERFAFKGKNNTHYTLYFISGFKTLSIVGLSTEFYAEATKENYTLACRKCKELFLGEK